eukprot:CAMPEP_0184492274 /NCGR_PEP_ID=MMETSP0113_2-20130426/22761_1 /TAXON_ID=91329 /ORGANISM="Norrisiella sphaerica, Strain BC52" /LENGTH=228 /DNA_ID=CAMNT_0026876977 /DNA_START=438 /DNA_END=1124 /DNA_ORIENTATION=-
MGDSKESLTASPRHFAGTQKRYKTEGQEEKSKCKDRLKNLHARVNDTPALSRRALARGSKKRVRRGMHQSLPLVEPAQNSNDRLIRSDSKLRIEDAMVQEGKNGLAPRTRSRPSKQKSKGRTRKTNFRRSLSMGDARLRPRKKNFLSAEDVMVTTRGDFYADFAELVQKSYSDYIETKYRSAGVKLASDHTKNSRPKKIKTKKISSRKHKKYVAPTSTNLNWPSLVAR